MCSKFKEKSLVRFEEYHPCCQGILRENKNALNIDKALQEYARNVFLELESLLFPDFASLENPNVKKLLREDKDPMLLHYLSDVVFALSQGHVISVTQRNEDFCLSLNYTLSVPLVTNGDCDLSFYIARFVNRATELLKEKAKNEKSYGK